MTTRKTQEKNDREAIKAAIDWLKYHNHFPSQAAIAAKMGKSPTAFSMALSKEKPARDFKDDFEDLILKPLGETLSSFKVEGNATGKHDKLRVIITENERQFILMEKIYEEIQDIRKEVADLKKEIKKKKSAS
jgi:malate/lactate dehydrogenase